MPSHLLGSGNRAPKGPLGEMDAHFLYLAAAGDQGRISEVDEKLRHRERLSFQTAREKMCVLVCVSECGVDVGV